MAGWWRRKRVQLSSVVFEISEPCNLDCRYCYNVWKMPSRSAKATTYDQADRTLRRLFRQADIRQVTITGGEPFLFPRLPEIALTCRLAGKAVAIITNGTVAQRDDYKQMVDLGVGLFELPLLSPSADVHDDLTRHPGAWARVHQSLSDLLDLGASIAVVVVVTRRNLDLLAATLHHLADLGITRVMVNRFNIGGSGIAQGPDLWLDGDAIRQMYAVASDVAADRKLHVTSGVCSPVCVIDPQKVRGVKPV